MPPEGAAATSERALNLRLQRRGTGARKLLPHLRGKGVNQTKGRKKALQKEATIALAQRKGETGGCREMPDRAPRGADRMEKRRWRNWERRVQ